MKMDVIVVPVQLLVYLAIVMLQDIVDLVAQE